MSKTNNERTLAREKKTYTEEEEGETCSSAHASRSNAARHGPVTISSKIRIPTGFPHRFLFGTEREALERRGSPADCTRSIIFQMQVSGYECISASNLTVLVSAMVLLTSSACCRSADVSYWE